MKQNLFLFVAILFIFGISPNISFGQTVSHDVIYPTSFSESRPLRDIVKDRPYVQMKKVRDELERESPDRENRTPQTFIYTPADGPQYGEDPAVRQTEMGKRIIGGSKAVIQSWAGQVASGFRPFDPTGAAGPSHYVQAINGTPFKVFNKTTGANMLTANISSLWSPATPDDGDPIIMYDKYADRWFVSQFGNTGNKIYIAISKTNDPTGAYYTYTYTSPQFPDYLKFSIWENGYYMTSNQSTDKVFCFERDQMLVGNASARSISANFTTGSTAAFFVPLPADAADGGLPPAGTPLPFFAYYDNAWGGGTDGVKIWNMTVTWGATASATISASTQVNTSAFDASYNASWNDVTQPGTTQKLDGIGGVPTFRAQWRPWSGYNSLVMNWGVVISASQRSIRWVELRQNQSTGTWTLYQEGTYSPDSDTRWLGSIAMDNNGSIGLAYCKSSSTTYPTLCYTGRLAGDPLGTMSFAETVAIAGTSSQTTGNRFGDYSHTSLDPDGITFWHTGEYIAGGVKTRVFSFQIPAPSVAPVADFSGTPTSLQAGNSVTYTDLSTNNPTSWNWSFPGGTPTTSNLQNPVIFYNTPGTYNVSLTATNAAGSNTKTKNNYITVTTNTSPPSADFVADNTTPCNGETVTFTDLTTGVPTSWSWSFSPSTVTFVNSTSSSSQNPQVVFNGSGPYSVTLTATNAYGNNSNTKTNYITPVATSSLPFVENFEGATFPPTGWTIENADGGATAWGTAGAKGLVRRAAAGNTGSTSGCAGIEFFNYDTDTSQVDNLISTPISMVGVSAAQMTFKRAYKYYNSATNPNNYHDELKIYVSTDCGATYGSALYFKKGVQLATNGTTNTTFTPSTAADWDTDTIDLSAYANQNINIKFEYGNRWGNNLYIDDINISATAALAPVAAFSGNPTTTLCTGDVQFTDASTNTPTSWLWNFGDGQTSTVQNPLHTYTTSGTYTVSLTATNATGSNQIVKTNYITVNMPVAPTVTPGSRCGTGTVNLSASGAGTIHWFDAATAGTDLGNGNNFTTPSISTTTTFYAEDHISPTSQFVGPLSNFAGGTYSNTAYTLTFDCISACNLVSVAIDKNGAGNITIELQDASSTVLQTGTFAVPNGASRVTLNWPLTPATGLKLVGPSGVSLWRVNTGGTFPYTLPGLVSITGCSSTTRYGSFFDWEIKEPDCVSSRTSVVATVNPAATTSVSIAATATTVCSGQSITFTANPTNGGTPTYQWKLNGGNVGTNSATYTNSTWANGDVVTCDMTSSLTCVTSPTVTSNSVTITITAPVAPAVSIAATATTICSGTSVTFTATPTNGGTPSYQWKLNGNNVGTNSATYTNTGLVNNDIVSCVMTSSLSCATTPTATSNSITMTVNATVTPSVSIAATATTVCSGQSITFTATPTNGGTPSYQWKLNGGNVGTNSATYTNAALVNGDVVSCVMTSSVFCTTSPTATSNSVTMTVNPSVTPSVSIAASATTMCSPAPVTFTATPTNGGTPTYQWLLNGANVGTNSSTYTSGILADGDIVTCDMTSSLSCVTSATVTSNAVSITINTPAAPTTTDNSRCGTGTVNLTASGAGTIHWFDVATAGTDLGTGATFTTPSISTTTTYYAEDHIAAASQYVGPLSNFAAGTYSNTAYTLTFDCISACNLVSVAIDKQNAGNITIQLQDAASNVLQTGTFAVPSGASRVTLNWPLTPGTGLKLVGPATAGLWRVNTAGTYPYTLNGLVSITGCSSGTRYGSFFDWEIKAPDCVSSRTPAIATIDPAATPDVSISATATTICSGTSVTFTATPTNGGTPSYQWKLNGGNVGTNSNTYTTSTLADGDVVTCVMTSSLACVTAATATSNAITITYSLTVTPSVVVSTGSTTICSGTSATFTATPTNGGTPTYQWYLNANPVGTNSATYTNGTLADGDIVSCDMTSSLGCATVPTVSSNNVTMTVTTTVAPSVSIASTATSICDGTSVTFTATPTNGGTPTYQWLLNGANVGTNSNTYTNAALTDGDIVSLDMTSSLTCVTSATVTSNAVTMTVGTTVTPSVSIAADATTICSGNSVIFTATPTNGGTPTYQWLLNSNPVGTNSNTYTNASLADGDIVSCEMTSSLSCVTIATVTSNSETITVSSGVTPTISIASTTTNICDGTSVTFTATATNGGTPTYQWLLNSNPVGTNSATYTNSALANGDIVSCDLTSSLSCASNPNASSNSVTMTVNANSNPSVSISSTATSICDGASVTFTSSQVDGGTPTYQWLVNGANVGTNADTYSSSTLADGDVVSCEMTSSMACASSPTVTSNTVTMAVGTIVTPSISIAASSNSICSGSSVTFTATAVNGGTPTYNWLLNGSNVGTNSDTYINGSLADGDVVSCQMTSSLGCVTIQTVTSNSETITVGTSVTTSIAIAANNTTICEGTTVTFIAAPTNGGTPTYQWLVNGSNAGTNSAVFTSSTLANNDVVTCEMTSSLACASAPTATSNAITMTVDPIATTSVAVTADATTICAGTNVTFTAAASNGGTPVYNWFLNGFNVGTNSSVYTNNTLANGDVVSCEMTSSLACVTNQTVASNDVTMTVNSVDNYTITSSDPVVSVSSLTGATYQWINCDNGNADIPGETGTSYTATANGNYGVVITQNGCTSTSSCVYVIATELSENYKNYDINVYPNPTNGIVNIYFGEELIDANISIENVVGQKVYELNSDQSKASLKSINLSKYSEGVYFINIYNKDMNVKYKLIFDK